MRLGQGPALLVRVRPSVGAWVVSYHGKDGFAYPYPYGDP